MVCYVCNVTLYARHHLRLFFGLVIHRAGSLPRPWRRLCTCPSTTHRHPSAQTYQTYIYLAWPQILEAVGAKVHLVNSSQEPKLIGRHEHFSQILPTGKTSSHFFTSTLPSLPQPVKPKSSLPFLSSMSVDSDNILPEERHFKL